MTGDDVKTGKIGLKKDKKITTFKTQNYKELTQLISFL